MKKNDVSKDSNVASRPQSSYLSPMTENNKSSGEPCEKALSDWFSTETIKNDFGWLISFACKIVRRKFYLWPR